jgi:catechol 2,3-dioxygenase-like lactoylglutathione lyase family enzyme
VTCLAHRALLLRVVAPTGIACSTNDGRRSIIAGLAALRRPTAAVTLSAVHVIFAVTDVGRSVAFYRDVFGWPRNERIHYDEYVELHAPDGTLGLCERETYADLTHATPMAPQNGDVSPAYLYVRVTDVRATVAKLAEAGARQLAPLEPRSWGEEAAWFGDPDGNVVAVAQAPE